MPILEAEVESQRERDEKPLPFPWQDELHGSDGTAVLVDVGEVQLMVSRSPRSKIPHSFAPAAVNVSGKRGVAASAGARPVGGDDVLAPSREDPTS